MKVGFLEFNDFAYVQFYLSTYHSKAAIQHAVSSTRYYKGGTDIANVPCHPPVCRASRSHMSS